MKIPLDVSRQMWYSNFTYEKGSFFVRIFTVYAGKTLPRLRRT
jgi:hypothetical protein